jgi:hypothetical protein
MNLRARGSPLPPETLSALRELVARIGLRGAAELTGASLNALRQAAAGFPVIHGTRLAIELGLRRAPVGIISRRGPRA